MNLTHIFTSVFVITLVTSGAQYLPPPVTAEVEGIIANQAEFNATLLRVYRWPTRVSFQVRKAGTKRWVRRSPWQRFAPIQDNVSFSALVTNLNWDTEYEVRAVSVRGGFLHPGNIVEFHSPSGRPQIVGTGQTNVTSSNAVITAQFYPNQHSTVAWFEWGTNTSYGNASSPVEIPAGTVAQNVSLPLQGLSSDTTTYHWRLVASNAAGVTMSSDAAFIATDYIGIPEGYSWTFSSLLPFVGKIFSQNTTQRAGAEFGILPGSFAEGSTLLCEMLSVSGGVPEIGGTTLVDAPELGGNVSIFAWTGWDGFGSNGHGRIRFTAQTGSVVLTNLIMTFEWGMGMIGDRSVYSTNVDLKNLP